LLAQERQVIERDPWARLALALDWYGDPATPGGPNGWAPLLYVTHSQLAEGNREELAAALLGKGADPNVTFDNEYGAMSALYGAAGVVFDPGLTALLLEAGADPDDNESLYHSCEGPDTKCTKLLLEYGARTRCTNALAHALDRDDIEFTEALLKLGEADANEGAVVAHAVRRGRGPEFIRLLADHGADLNRKGGETWRGDVPLRTPYAHAVIRGNTDVADTLRQLGADTTVDPADEELARIHKGETPQLPDELDPDVQEVLITAALNGNLDAVVRTVGVDFEGVVAGSPKCSLLQHAEWVGNQQVVDELLRRRARR
jgi:ankyrin repeat protein